MKKKIAVFFMAALVVDPIAASGSAQLLRIEDLAGAYNFHHKIGIYYSPDKTEIVQVDDVLEIVKISDRDAYMRVHLRFDNGHICNFSAIGTLEGDSLVYRTQVYDALRQQERTCTFSLVHDAKKIQVTDPGQVCRINTCGARGLYDRAQFQTKTHRRIRYMPALLNSREYQEAIAKFRGTATASEPAKEKSISP